MAEGETGRPDVAGMAARGDAAGLIGAVKGAGQETESDILDALIGIGEPAVPAYSGWCGLKRFCPTTENSRSGLNCQPNRTPAVW